MIRLRHLWLAIFLSIAAPVLAETNLTVAADGSAQFKTVQEAVMSVPSGSRTNPVIIHIKPGIYHELVYVQREKCFFKLVGENPTNTVLTYGLYAGMTNLDGKPIGTFRTPSTLIDADDFTAENITFENSAGPVGQALAIRVDGDRATFRNCRFLGWQDTILLNRGRQYFEDCYIAGHVDFIFGAATAWFERCQIHCMGGGYLTAASTPADQPYGFVFSSCKVTAEKPEIKSLLGRPWRIYASTIFLNTDMGDVIRPVGWSDWNKPETHQTARYAEYNSKFGEAMAGTNAPARPAWIRQLTKAEANAITVEKVLGGNDGWDPTMKMNPAYLPTQRDIEYGRAAGESLRLDAFTPETDGLHPIAIIVHGGGWMSGDKRHDINTLFEPLGKAGFTWFSIDYRLVPTNRWPACYEDLQTAIRWAKAHAAEYKGDPKRVVLFGYSAGGQLVTLAGTRGGKSRSLWQALHLTRRDETVQAVVGLAPPTDLVSDNERRGGLTISMRSLFNFDSTNITDAVRVVLRENSPLTYARPGLPPFLIIQGDSDKTVPIGQSQAFQAALKKNGVVCDLIAIQDGQHRIRDWDRLDPAWKAQLVDWLKKNLP